jgi:hypothetical protein
MAGKLHRGPVQAFIDMTINDKKWTEIKTLICANDPKISEVFKNLYGYIDRVKR